MTYQWKLPGLMPVPAQTAGEELERIYQAHGAIDPAFVVDESRPESAPLHPCFEWDDHIAAEKYRQNQARMVIRSVVTVQETHSGQPVSVRAFVQTETEYKPISVAMSSEEQMEELLGTALQELSAFRRKYAVLSALMPVFSAIDQITA